MEFKELLFLKKSNVLPKEGDIFIINPKEKIYCFGKVIRNNVYSKDSFMNGMNLIYIYDYFSETKIVPDKLYKYGLIFIGVINNQLWRKGFAETIEHQDVCKEEKNLDYAFWDVVKKKYVDIEGNEINRIPQYYGTFGLGSYGLIGKTIQSVIRDRNL